MRPKPGHILPENFSLLDEIEFIPRNEIDEVDIVLSETGRKAVLLGGNRAWADVRDSSNDRFIGSFYAEFKSRADVNDPNCSVILIIGWVVPDELVAHGRIAFPRLVDVGGERKGCGGPCAHGLGVLGGTEDQEPLGVG